MINWEGLVPFWEQTSRLLVKSSGFLVWIAIEFVSDILFHFNKLRHGVMLTII